jgi:hypothetical protein
MKKLKPILLLLFVLFMNVKVFGQTLTYTFIDPCTKDVTYFSIPIQGGTVIFFLGQQRSFTAADVASGDFANWTNQVYADYRKVSPCGVQQGQVTQNQITSQIIGGTVQSVVGSIMSQAKVESNTSDVGGGSDAAGKNNKSDEKKSTKTNNGTTNSNGGSSNSSTNQNGGQSQDNSGTTGSTGGSTGTQGDGNTTSGGGSTGSGNSTQGGGSSSQPTVGSGTAGGGGGTGTSSETKTETQGTEVAGTTTMSVDAKNDRGSDNSSSGGGGGSKKSGNSNQRSNPIIVSSDLTSAQNLDKSFTGIINVGTSRSSLTGSSSWGVTSMIWFNLKQAAITGRYTKIHYSKDRKLKLIHNLNLTGVYSYGNYMGFVGYSAILNAGKWGITGANVSGAITKTPDDQNLFISPSITAFYTKPFRASKKVLMSPELYIISTPLIYSSVDKVSVTDRTFSAFIGTGIDYQVTKRFKVNINYKANMSTNPSFPILSFFLIGSKINL